MKKNDLEMKIKEHETQLKELRALRDELLTNTLDWKCPHCNKKSKAKNSTLVSKYYYVRPYSCAEGDYWNFKEYLLYCAKCANYCRAYPNRYNSTDVRTLEAAKREAFVVKNIYFFGERLDWYPHEGYRNSTFDIELIRNEHREREERRNRS